MNDAPAARDWRSVLLLAAGVAILAPPLIQATTPVSPVEFFDVDPRSVTGRMPLTAIGPTGMAWLHVLTVLLAAAVMAISTMLGAAVRWLWVGLAAVGVLGALLQLNGPLEQWLQVGAWISSACLGLAAAHLAQHEVARRFMVAALIALLVPLGLNAGLYVLVEHPMTVEHYESSKEELLAARGWQPDSTQAEVYERRLTDSSVLGAYGLSNVFGSVTAGLTLLAAGVMLFSAARREETDRQPWLQWAPLAPMVLGLVTTLLTQSKGVMAAACAGVALLAGAWMLRGKPARRLVLPAAAMLLLLGAIAAVFVRGWIGAPETHEGERSLLFRWQYWQAAAQMLAEASPIDWLLGLGPERFHVEYELYKNPLSPEVVTSTHSVFVDWVTMLGLGGLAWSVLLGVWLWHAGQPATEEPMPAEEPAAPPLLPAITLAVVVFGTQYVVRLSQMWIDSILVWLVGAAGFAVVTVWMARLLASRPRAVAPAAFVAAAVILVHAQIEMTFFQYPSLPMVWVLMGLAAGAVLPATRTGGLNRQVALSAGGVSGTLGILAVVLAVVYAAPMAAVQAKLADAVTGLWRGRPVQAIEDLDAAGRLAPGDPRILRWRVQLRQEWAREVVRAGRPDQLEQPVREALGVLERDHAVLGPSPDRLRSSLHEFLATARSDPRHLEQAVAARLAALKQSPYNLTDQRALAELYDRLGRREEAMAAYEQALHLSGLKYLDPAEQLTPEEQDRINARIQALSTP